MDKILNEVMIGQLVEKEIKHKEAGEKMCTNCGFRSTNPMNRTKLCSVCFEEKNGEAVDKMLTRIYSRF